MLPRIAWSCSGPISDAWSPIYKGYCCAHQTILLGDPIGPSVLDSWSFGAPIWSILPLPEPNKMSRAVFKKACNLPQMVDTCSRISGAFTVILPVRLAIIVHFSFSDPAWSCLDIMTHTVQHSHHSLPYWESFLTPSPTPSWEPSVSPNTWSRAVL